MNGTSPPDLQAAISSPVASDAPPYGASMARVSRLDTRSRAQNTPSPRTSPITGCRVASSRRPGPSTSAPTLAAFSTMPSSFIASSEATIDAQASGWPEYVRPPGNTRSSNVAAISSEMITPPTGTYPELEPFANVIRSGTTPWGSNANQVPARPKPHMTSSAMYTMPYLSHSARTPAR